VEGLHVPARWQASPGVQVTGMPAVQAPAWQVSPVVHLSPSSHEAPSDLVVHDVWLLALLHPWQLFPGAVSPSAKQAPSITQVPSLGG
jgi:hypothetical protein